MKGKKSFGLLLVIVLGIGVITGSIAVQNSTLNQQHASQYNDLNSADEITYTNNADGTMGPATWEGNFSNTLPAAYLGTLNFQVTDPVQGKRPTEVEIPSVTHTVPTRTMPTEAEKGEFGKPTTTPGQEDKDGPQQLSSLVLTITKVEVHLARLGIPGAKNENQAIPTEHVNPTDIEHGRPTGVEHGKPTGIKEDRPSVTPAKDNQGVDKWETLNLNGSKTIDLVALAKNHDLTSIGLTKLANGFYTEVRLYIGTATATLADGTKVTLTIPGKANTVRVVGPFFIDSGKVTTVTFDFDAQNSVIKAGGLYLLKPVVAHFRQENQ